MKNSSLLLFVFLPLLVAAQTNLSTSKNTRKNGIPFETGLSWNQVLAKAKAENKYIFIDCYATWCGPCKEMDKNIYPLSKVGEVFDKNFISVKLQMDKTDNDNAEVKSWYYYANEFQVNYTILSFPTYLFFSPDGKPAHKAGGYKEADAFIAVAHDAMNPSKAYYKLVENFKPGTIDTAELKGLAKAYSTQGIELSEKLIMDYLDRIPQSEKFSDDNLIFIGRFAACPKLQTLVYNYLDHLSKKEFGLRKNRRLAVDFCNGGNKKGQAQCVNYLKSLTPEEFRDSNNLKFVRSLLPIPDVQVMVANYLSALSHEDWDLKSNLKLAAGCSMNEEVSGMANKRILMLSKKAIKKEYVIEFIAAFIKKTSDPGFKLLFENQARVNKTMGGKEYLSNVFDGAILSTDINPVIKSTPKEKFVDFDAIYKGVKDKYGIEYADRNVLKAKLAYYNYWAANYDPSKWHEYFQLAIEHVNKYGPPPYLLGPNGSYNSIAWDMFQYSDDKSQLELAVKWMEKVVNDPNNKPVALYIDTYANLLYKTGKTNEAIIWETKALSISPYNKDLQQALNKMKRDEPTW